MLLQELAFWIHLPRRGDFHEYSIKPKPSGWRVRVLCEALPWQLLEIGLKWALWEKARNLRIRVATLCHSLWLRWVSLDAGQTICHHTAQPGREESLHTAFIVPYRWGLPACHKPIMLASSAAQFCCVGEFCVNLNEWPPLHWAAKPHIHIHVPKTCDLGQLSLIVCLTF